MPIRYRTQRFLASVNTSKLLSVTTAETFYMIGTGNVALEAINLGDFKVFYGNTGVLSGSGGVILPLGSKFWDTVTGDFQMYFVIAEAGSASNLMVHEYAGNSA